MRTAPMIVAVGLAVGLCACKPSVPPQVDVTTTPTPTSSAAASSIPEPTAAPTFAVTATTSTNPSFSDMAAAAAVPTPIPSPIPVGAGTITVDGQRGAAVGDCVVSMPQVAVGPIEHGARIRLATRATLPAPERTVAVVATTSGGLSVRVDSSHEDGGAWAWESSAAVIGLSHVTSTGHATLTLTAQVAAASRPAVLQVAPIQPTPGPTPSGGGTPLPPPPQRTRPDPVPQAVPSDAPDRVLHVEVACRVTTDPVD